MNTMDDKLPILVDLRKNRIRIHKKTIHALGDPDYVILVINPAQHAFGIRCGSYRDGVSHRIPKSVMRSKICVELCSKPFVSALLKICPEWQKDAGYRMEGRLIPNQQMVFYNMDAAIMIQETDGSV